jgi:hypothetical protein
MKKAFAVTLIIVLAINMILLGLGRISPLMFWLIIAAVAAFAFLILPRIP